MTIKNYFLLHVLLCVMFASQSHIYGMQNNNKSPRLKPIEMQENDRFLKLWIKYLYRSDEIQWLDKIQALLELEDVSWEDQQDLNSVLFYACRVGYNDLVKRLIALGANVQSYIYKNNQGVYITPLGVACEYKQFETMKILLESGKVNLLWSPPGENPLLWELTEDAIISRDELEREDEALQAKPDFIEKLNILLSAATTEHINYQNEEGDTLLYFICSEWVDLECIRLLLKYEANPNVKNNKGRTPLHALLKYTEDMADAPEGNAVVLKIIKKFFNYGADLFALDNEKNGLLHVMQQWKGKLFQEKLNNIIFLLENGVNPRIKNKQGQTVLHTLIKSSKDELTDEQLAKEKNFNTYCRMVDALILHGADVHAKDNNRNTPLHYAAHYECPACVPMLLFHGAQPAEKNIEGRIAQSLAGDTPLNNFSTYNTGGILLKDIFAIDFVDTPLGKQCMQDCKAHSIRSMVLEKTGNPVRFLKAREIGFR